MSLIGAGLGLLAALGGFLAVSGSPPSRRPRLLARLTPYLGEAGHGAGRASGTPGASGLLGAAARLADPVLRDLARSIERVAGGTRSVRRRLVALGSTRTVEDVRVEQAVAGLAGLAAGAVLGAFAAVTASRFSVVAVLLVAATGAVAGVLGRDWWLSVQVRRMERELLAELPVVAELLALAVTAGEGPAAAIERVVVLCQGELSRELGRAVADTRAGSGLSEALRALGARTSADQVARFVDGIAVALERGTPMADVLRAQAVDAREAGKRELLASGGRREIAMMVPVVFLVLPITVAFALFPGLVTLTLLTR
jgi:tight adherence protein C